MNTRIKRRLDYLRKEIEAERISYGEIAELQDLAKYIDPSDVLLLEWAGVPEHGHKHVSGLEETTNRTAIAKELVRIAKDLIAAKPVDVTQLMAYEDGSLSEDETVELFQQLIDTGMAWQLQGAYGRMAHHLIQQGLCHR